MSYDDLVCAACSGRVVDGGCPTCRAARQHLRSETKLPAELFLTLAAVMALLLILATHLRG
ncbi:MAG: hypothetical protein JWN35_2311 [Frankiales bacterium]|jgi:hypothetical protein|nr:hypothetical protein [Frankiales bacterium]